MRVLLDTSVVVAALLPAHPMHTTAFPWLDRAQAGGFDFIFSAHSIAEVYAVLTRMPLTPLMAPAVALQLLRENVLSYAEITALTGEEYVAMVEDFAASGHRGGAIYDAVIARVAEKGRVDYLVTFNTAHFQRVWPTGAARVVAPHAIAVP